MKIMFEGRYQFNNLVRLVNFLLPPAAIEATESLLTQLVPARKLRYQHILYLIKQGRLSLAAGAMVKFVKDRPDDLECHYLIGRLAEKQGDFPGAVVAFRRYIDLGGRFHEALLAYARVLWHLGQAEAYWHAGLAMVSRNYDLLSADAAVRQAALQDLAVASADICQALSGSDALRRGDALDLAESVSRRTAVIKTYREADNRTAQFLAGLAELESSGNWPEAWRHIETGLPHVLAKTKNSELRGGLLGRAAFVCERNGNIAASMKFLERAAFVDKGEPGFAAGYRRVFRLQPGILDLAGATGTAKLILTCSKTRARAITLASAIHENTGEECILLRGDAGADLFTLTRIGDFGHELVVPCDDGYLALPRKVVLACRFLAICTRFAGVLKIDDDTMIRDYRRFGWLARRLSLGWLNYAGEIREYLTPIFHFGRSDENGLEEILAGHNPVKFCNGACYYLSRRALGIILDMSLRFFDSAQPRCIYEDVHVGEMLASQGMLPQRLDIQNLGGLLTDAFELTNLGV